MRAKGREGKGREGKGREGNITKPNCIRFADRPIGSNRPMQCNVSLAVISSAVVLSRCGSIVGSTNPSENPGFETETPSGRTIT